MSDKKESIQDPQLTEKDDNKRPDSGEVPDSAAQSDRAHASLGKSGQGESYKANSLSGGGPGPGASQAQTDPHYTQLLRKLDGRAEQYCNLHTFPNTNAKEHAHSGYVNGYRDALNKFTDLLRDLSKRCLCTRNTVGFDYGETHSKLGKPGIGKRWLTPEAVIENVLIVEDSASEAAPTAEQTSTARLDGQYARNGYLENRVTELEHKLGVACARVEELQEKRTSQAPAYCHEGCYSTREYRVHDDKCQYAKKARPGVKKDG